MDERLFHNALSVKEGYPMRLTETQLDRYSLLSPEFAARAKCTAGVKLSFYTEAKRLSFDYEVVSWCRSTNIVDVFEDGILTGHVRLADMQSHGKVSILRNINGEKRIDLYLPNTCGLRITGCDFGKYRPVHSVGEKILLLGDSILQGINSYHPSGTLSGLLLACSGVEGINQSVGGGYYDPVFLEDTGFLPDRIIIAMGANDADDQSEAYTERIPAWYGKLRELYPQTPAVTVTPIWGLRHTTDPDYFERVKKVAACISENACKHDVRVIDGNGMVPHHMNFFNEDGCHPNDLGFAHYALNFEKAIHA